jgi:hypothetical protein
MASAELRPLHSWCRGGGGAGRIDRARQNLSAAERAAALSSRASPIGTVAPAWDSGGSAGRDGAERVPLRRGSGWCDAAWASSSSRRAVVGGRARSRRTAPNKPPADTPAPNASTGREPRNPRRWQSPNPLTMGDRLTPVTHRRGDLRDRPRPDASAHRRFRRRPGTVKAG